jgi:hypothetical protein
MRILLGTPVTCFAVRRDMSVRDLIYPILESGFERREIPVEIFSGYSSQRLEVILHRTFSGPESFEFYDKKMRKEKNMFTG